MLLSSTYDHIKRAIHVFRGYYGSCIYFSDVPQFRLFDSSLFFFFLKQEKIN